MANAPTRLKAESSESGSIHVPPGLDGPEGSTDIKYSLSRDGVESLRDKLKDAGQSLWSQKGTDQETGSLSPPTDNIEKAKIGAYEREEEQEKERGIKAMIFRSLRQQPDNLNGWRAQLSSGERRRLIYKMLAIPDWSRPKQNHY